MILLINICKEKLHSLEFVKPIEDILKRIGKAYFVKKYREVLPADLKKATKIIICGTSLKDNEFSLSENWRFFKWIKDFDNPILGICGGMQILGMTYGGRIRKETEIGFFKENFEKEFLGIVGMQEIYHLHNYFIDFGHHSDIEFYSVSEKNIVEAFKHKTREVYGVLFHPEVRQKVILENFAKL